MKIQTLKQIERLANERRSVIRVFRDGTPFDYRPIPAAIMLGMPGKVICGMIRFGLATYTPPKKTKPKHFKS